MNWNGWREGAAKVTRWNDGRVGLLGLVLDIKAVLSIDL